MIEMGEELDFDVIKENWSKYKLEDGSILRIKNPTIKIYETEKKDNMGIPIYRVAGQTLISSTVPAALKGNPSEDESITPKDIGDELKFTIITEEWSEYKLSNGVIYRCKTVATKISKTKKFNQLREPIYWCNWQIITDKTMPKLSI